jgi:hypothetical protein
MFDGFRFPIVLHRDVDEAIRPLPVNEPGRGPPAAGWWWFTRRPSTDRHRDVMHMPRRTRSCHSAWQVCSFGPAGRRGGRR